MMLGDVGALEDRELGEVVERKVARRVETGGAQPFGVEGCLRRGAAYHGLQLAEHRFLALRPAPPARRPRESAAPRRTASRASRVAGRKRRADSTTAAARRPNHSRPAVTSRVPGAEPPR